MAKPSSPGMAGDAAVVRATGRDWASWFADLDQRGARERSHREIARFLEDERGVSGWWAQQITVGYERARGMRAVHQVAGGFAANVSSTIPASAAAIFAHWTDEVQRARWLPVETLCLRSSSPGKSARFDAADGSLVAIFLTSKGEAKTAVQVQIGKLPDADAVAAAKAMWKQHLAKLAAVVSEDSPAGPQLVR